MSVYLITCRAINVVKIGSSKNPHHRLRQLKTGCSHPVVLEAVLPDRANELEVHHQFKDQRLEGEWFKITPEVEALIAANPAPPPPSPKPDTAFSPLLVGWAERQRADFERRISAIRKAEAEGRIKPWIGPSEAAGVLPAKFKRVRA